MNDAPKLLPVSKAVADFFQTQCIGGYSGHMAEIAFSPTIKAILEAHGVRAYSNATFAEFLRAVAEQIESPA